LICERAPRSTRLLFLPLGPNQILWFSKNHAGFRDFS